MEHETEWDELPAKELARAFEACLIGGNGIASALIGILGPNFPDLWHSYGEASTGIRSQLGDSAWYPVYEMWQSWFGMMRERERLRALLPTSAM